MNTCPAYPPSPQTHTPSSHRTALPAVEDESDGSNNNSGKPSAARIAYPSPASKPNPRNFLLDNVSIHKDNSMSSPTGRVSSSFDKPSTDNNYLIGSNTRPHSFHQRSKTLNFEPKSITYLHQKRFSDSENNPFLLSKNLENTTSNNTELNKRLSLSDLMNPGGPDDSTSSAISVGDKNSPFNLNSSTSSSTITENSDSACANSINDEPVASTPSKNLIRKKTGEIVKSSLKLSSLANMGNYERSSQSLPTTPTYKSVHFNNKSFADVKYFNEKDTPEAISTEVTPLQACRRMSSKRIASRNKKKSLNWLIGDSGSEDSDSDFSDDDIDAYNDDDDDDYYSNYKTGLDNAKWKLEALNFNDSGIYEFKINENLPVFVERFFLTTDRKFFKGYIAVKNLSFQKRVTIKYSLNNWKIISEIDAIYVPDVPRILRKNNYDRFAIKIPISALVTDNNSNNNTIDNKKFNRFYAKEKVILVAVVRYICANQEYWDNNYSKNYEMVFKNENFKEYSREGDDDDEYYSSKNNDSGFMKAAKKKTKNAGLANNFNFSDDDILSDDTLILNNKHEEYFPRINTLSPISLNFKNESSTNSNIDQNAKNVNAISSSSSNSLEGNSDSTANSSQKSSYHKYNKFELGESLLERPEMKSPTSLFYSAGVNAASTAESLVFGGKPSLGNDTNNFTTASTTGIPSIDAVASNPSKNVCSPVSPARILNMEDASIVDKTKPVLSPHRAQQIEQEAKKQDSSINLTSEIAKLRQSQHSTDSSDYQKLVQSYCFFQG